MESFIGIAGGLAMLVILAIAGIFVYLLLFRRKGGSGNKQEKHIGLTKCPICGARMESLPGKPHIIRCVNTGCPNYQSET